MKVLCIGNSFSQNATKYLYSMAASCGIEMKTVNLYIGGCSLRRHYVNMMDDRAAYALMFNGMDTGFSVSLRQALFSDEFDVVTLQQASPLSFKADTYFPYIERLTELIQSCCPKAKIYLHQTWAYRPDSARLSHMGFSSHAEMYEAVKASYGQVYDKINAQGLLPSGEVMARLCKEGLSGSELFADDIHASAGLGQYALALTWLEYLTGIPAETCSFLPDKNPLSQQEISAAKKAAHEGCLWAAPYKKH